MSGTKNSCNSATAVHRTKLERHLRERELRKSNRSVQPNEEFRDGNRETDLFVDHQFSSEGDEEEFVEGITPTAAFSDGHERQDGQRPKRRLLVVANRLPVSAVRRGEDTWQLEISVGGLVSALLGKYQMNSLNCFYIFGNFGLFAHHCFVVSRF